MSARTSAQIIEGGCLCAAIRYRVLGAPLSSIICHCATCRRACSAPSVAWLTVDRENFELLSGHLQAFQSSHGVVRRFCGACGSQISYEDAHSPATIDLTTVSLDNPNDFPPNLEAWVEHKIPWQAANQSLRQYQRSGDDDDAHHLAEHVMTRRLISSGSQFERDIGYSRAVVEGDWVFVSGTTGFDYATMSISDSLLDQTEQCLKNIQSALREAGAEFADVVRVTYVLPNAARFPECWPILRKYLGEVRPAAMMICAGLSDPRMQIEIEVTARKRAA